MEKRPLCRFKGYKEEWLETQLSKIATRVNRKNEDLKSDRVLTISAQYGLIDQNDFFNRRIASNSIQGYFLMESGEFAYNKSYSSEYPVGAVKRLKLYDLGVLSTLYILFSIDDESLAEWIEAFFESDKWHREVIKRASEGARNHGLLNISPSDFFELPFYYPSTPEEQHQIAKFFSRLDILIAAEDKRLARLKNMKAASLEKMFPKQGETTPQIRFKGFTGEWDECKLGDISNKVLEKNSKNAIQEVFTNSAEFGIISQRDFFNHDIANVKSIFGYYVVQPNDFVYNPRMSVTAPVGPINRNKLFRSGVMSPLYYVFRVHDIQEGYLEYYFKTTHWHKFMYNNGDNGARGDRFSIKDETLIKMPIPMPKDEKEQIYIADFFSRLDTLISAQEQKVSKLRSLKKSFLEKMFVTLQK